MNNNQVIMVTINIEYLGDLHCKVTHEPSQTSFLTDAPLDNQGRAEYISPTDLTAASIASCIATIMGIAARGRNLDIQGLRISAKKEMSNVPYRRISAIYLEIDFPVELDEEGKKLFVNIVKNCPVSRSLSPEIKIETTFKIKGEVIDINEYLK
ncbi:MAG TPA: OsmC family protein [Candidatus Kapabacteria bacterium]|jgi:putative redox protein|nr:OsmC family protein [Candidatus Kapabacteria bacterium]HPP40653.1 OsmC family protein [Candidatus Kapabacteria bacterium]